jgi:hypothetical protein
MLEEHAIADRNALVAHGQSEAVRRTGMYLLWPDTMQGEGYPVRATSLTNAARLQTEGVSLFDDVQVVVSASYFTTRRPQENQACRFKSAPGEPWRRMKITSVDVVPGAGVLMLHLNSAVEGA